MTRYFLNVLKYITRYIAKNVLKYITKYSFSNVLKVLVSTFHVTFPKNKKIEGKKFQRESGEKIGFKKK